MEPQNDDQVYCITNDFRARNFKAKEFKTSKNCRFENVLSTNEINYCTFTALECKKRRFLLDNEQEMLDVFDKVKDFRTVQKLKKYLKNRNIDVDIQKNGRTFLGTLGTIIGEAAATVAFEKFFDYLFE